MTVKELIELLKLEDPNRLVVMAKDSEGNNFSPMSDMSTYAYDSYNNWSGDIGLEKLTDELKNQGYTEEDVVDGIPSLVLWPLN